MKVSVKCVIQNEQANRLKLQNYVPYLSRSAPKEYNLRSHFEAVKCRGKFLPQEKVILKGGC